MTWKYIEDGHIPPYDTAVLVAGTGGTSFANWPVYAIAFNDCFPPIMGMSQIMELPDGSRVVDKNNNTRVMIEVPFKIEKWCEIKE